MRLNHVIIVAVIFAILACGCSKKKEEKQEVVAEAIETAIQPILTNALLDTFIQQWPIVRKAIDEKKDAIGNIDPSNPVESAKANKAIEEVQEDLAKKGIDLNRFMVIYQKIIYSFSYLKAKEEYDLMTPEQKKEEIDRMKAIAKDPSTPPEQVEKINIAISELETKGMTIPTGLTTAEVELVRVRMNDIVNASQPQQTAPVATTKKPK